MWMRLGLGMVMLVAGLQAAAVDVPGDVVRLEFSNWTIWYNCDKRGYQVFHFQTVPDEGNLPRYEPFHPETQLPDRCRQFTTRSYSLPAGSPIRYDRGHGVHQNIWDHDANLMITSNSMANIVPQASGLNRQGAWRVTEKLEECWRDHGTVKVWGGVIWGRNTLNDHFVRSHGVVTPDQLWKVIEFPNGEVNAWLMPNNDEPTAKRIDAYLIAPEDLAGFVGFSFPIEPEQNRERDSRGVRMPARCDWS